MTEPDNACRLADTIVALIAGCARKTEIPTVFTRYLTHFGITGIAVEHGPFGSAVRQQRFDNFLMRVTVMDLHRQIEFLRERDVRAEGFSLQFFGGFSGAEEVHAGFAYGHNLIGVGDGKTVHFGHGVFEAGVVPWLVFEWQSVWTWHSAVAVEHGFVGVYGDGGMHGLGVFACHVDGGHEVRQFASAVDDAFDADLLCLVQQFVDAVYGDFRLAFFLGFMAHGPRERHDGRHMRVVVDDVRVLGKWLRCWRPAAVTMVFAHASSLRSMAVLLRKSLFFIDGSGINQCTSICFAM